MSLENAFHGKTVFLTGHTGFKGSWLAIWLHKLGAKVTGFSLEPETAPNNFIASGVEALMARHIIGDIRDAAHLETAIAECAPDYVLHLAAQAIVRESYTEPAVTFDTNVMGTVNVLEAVRAAGRPMSVVIVSSDKCYENREQDVGYRESDAMGGYDPYSASKGATELVVSSWRRSFFPADKISEHGVGLASARAGNVLGGGDWAADRIMTDIVAAITSGQPVELRNPSAVRPWQHVLEPLSGYLTLAAKLHEDPSPAWADGWNFGPTDTSALPVRDVVELAIKAWGSGSWADVSGDKKPHEAGLLKLNIDKAVTELGWRPRWSIETCIDRTMGWFKAMDSGADSMLTTCLSDIAAYESAAASR